MNGTICLCEICSHVEVIPEVSIRHTACRRCGECIWDVQEEEEED